MCSVSADEAAAAAESRATQAQAHVQALRQQAAEHNAQATDLQRQLAAAHDELQAATQQGPPVEDARYALKSASICLEHIMQGMHILLPSSQSITSILQAVGSR